MNRGPTHLNTIDRGPSIARFADGEILRQLAVAVLDLDAEAGDWPVRPRVYTLSAWSEQTNAVLLEFVGHWPRGGHVRTPIILGGLQLREWFELHDERQAAALVLATSLSGNRVPDPQPQLTAKARCSLGWIVGQLRETAAKAALA